jgi:asparagine synthetase A
MIKSEAIKNIISDDSWIEAMADLTKLNTDIIVNSDVEDKEIREIAYMKVKVINEILAHLESIASDEKINNKKWKI